MFWGLYSWAKFEETCFFGRYPWADFEGTIFVGRYTWANFEEGVCFFHTLGDNLLIEF